VSPESSLITGPPKNDSLLKAQPNKTKRSKISIINELEKIVLPEMMEIPIDRKASLTYYRW